jgi:hypothetical protein
MGKIIESYVFTDLKCEEFEGRLYCANLSFKNLSDICFIEMNIKKVIKYFVLGVSGHIEYKYLLTKYLEGNMDLSLIRSRLSLSWAMNNELNNFLLEKIVENILKESG